MRSPTVGLVLLVMLNSLGLWVDLFAESLAVPMRSIILVIGVAISVVVYVREFYVPSLRVQGEYEVILVTQVLNALIHVYREDHPGEYT